MLDLSIIIHTKNEATNIAECIKSCKNIATEILVIDMQSVDATRTIAKKLGATVISVEDHGFVEPVRQLAIEQAQFEWIFILDADERLTPELSKIVHNYIKNPTHTIVRLPRKNIMFSKWMRHGKQWPDYQVRLFKKGSLAWPRKIHQEPELYGSALSFPAMSKYAIVHYHTTSIKQRLAKIETQAFSENFYSTQSKVASKERFARMMNEFPDRFFAHDGYKDGEHGFIAAKLMEYYRFLEYAKYWEENGCVHAFPTKKLKVMWNTNMQIQVLMRENRELRDSKFYQLYFYFKNLIANFGFKMKRAT